MERSGSSQGTQDAIEKVIRDIEKNRELLEEALSLMRGAREVLNNGARSRVLSRAEIQRI